MPEPHDPAAKDYTDREVRHLKEYLSEKIEAGDAANDAAIKAADKALQIALDEQRSWRAAANEWRASLNDQSTLNMPRKEIETRFDSQDKDIDVLKAFMYAQQGSKASLVAGIGVLLGVIGAGLAIFNTIRSP